MLDLPSEHSESTPENEQDEDHVEKWREFLDSYSRGQFPLSGAPPPPTPPLAAGLKPEFVSKNDPLPPFETPIYPPGKINPDTARAINQFYQKHSFLPPPRSDAEVLRTRMIRQYNLSAPDQLENFDRCSSVVNTFFNKICTISLFKGNVQVVMSVAGDFAAKRGLELESETGICSHVVLRRDRKVVELHEVVNDWRFLGNPWCQGGYIGGYVGIPILLEVDPTSSVQEATSLAVGVIAVMDIKPVPPLTDAEKKLLDDLSTMLSIQLRSTWEGWRRGKEVTLRASVSEFLELALLKPLQNTRPGITNLRSTNSYANEDSGPADASSLAEAAKRLRRDIPVELAIIVDLSSFYASDNSQGHFRWLEKEKLRELRPDRVMAFNVDPKYLGWEEKFRAEEAMHIIASFLHSHAKNNQTLFDESSSITPSGGLSGLEALLPVPMTAHLAIPFYVAGRPDILILAASSAPFFSFSPLDVTYVSNLGVILVAQFLQTGIVSADAAKTTFVSHISHELRTPLHGLLSQLELLKDSFNSGETSLVASLLEGAEYCGTVLKDIVNDVLDFGKVTEAHSGRGNSSTKPRAESSANLVQLVQDAARSCWSRFLQRRSISGTWSSGSPGLKLTVVYENRSMEGWQALLDVSGLRRVLYNLIDNSLKYTVKGTITISMRIVTSTGTTRDVAEIQVEDTGCGIDDAFRDRMFEPFTQESVFSPGVGLGLHITKTIVARMDGQLTVRSKPGVGSTFTFTFPLTLANLGSAPQAQQTPTCCHVISDSVEVRGLQKLSLQTSPGDAVAETRVSVTDPEPTERLRVLVVEDDAVSRRILLTLTKRLKVSSAEADDGISAIEMFKTFSPHLVLTDVSMPRMDGITAAKEMRRIEREGNRPPAYIVAITGLGRSDEARRKEGLLGDAALDQWLVKGQTNLATLREIIKNLKASHERDKGG